MRRLYKYFLFDQNINWIISSSAGSYFQFNDSGHREPGKFISQHGGGLKHQVSSFSCLPRCQQYWKSPGFCFNSTFSSYRKVDLSQGIYHVSVSCILYLKLKNILPRWGLGVSKVAHSNLDEKNLLRIFFPFRDKHKEGSLFLKLIHWTRNNSR